MQEQDSRMGMLNQALLQQNEKLTAQEQQMQQNNMQKDMQIAKLR